MFATHTYTHRTHKQAEAHRQYKYDNTGFFYSIFKTEIYTHWCGTTGMGALKYNLIPFWLLFRCVSTSLVSVSNFFFVFYFERKVFCVVLICRAFWMRKEKGAPFWCPCRIGDNNCQSDICKSDSCQSRCHD